MEKITIYDVAEKAGVSVTSVSRVLNNRGYISENLKMNVLNAIKELDYTPNEIARSFFTNKTKFIALIIPTTSNPFFGELTFWIEKFLSRKGYSLFICNSINDSENEKRYLSLLSEKRVDGIIVGSHNIDISEYENYGKDIVSIERELTENIPLIQSDNYQGGKIATQKLIEANCKKILCVSGDSEIKTPANNRLKAYLDCTKENNLEPYVLKIPFTLPQKEKENIIKAIFLNGNPYDGIFAGDDVLAIMIYNIAKQNGINIPNELKIIGFDGTEMIRTLMPQLATIVQPIEKLAETTVEVLLKKIMGEPVNRINTVSVSYHDGEI